MFCSEIDISPREYSTWHILYTAFHSLYFSVHVVAVFISSMIWDTQRHIHFSKSNHRYKHCVSMEITMINRLEQGDMYEQCCNSGKTFQISKLLLGVKPQSCAKCSLQDQLKFGHVLFLFHLLSML